ncbi:MAG: type II toxin-antitoxin system Phd/YefM family antitoxin [Duganella sp.]
MMDSATFRTFSAKDAKARFDELLDEALAQPIGITKHNRLTAFIVSKNDYEAMLDNMQKLEDQLWLTRAELARKEGFAGAERISAFVSSVEESRDEKAGANSSC